jgi:transposase
MANLLKVEEQQAIANLKRLGWGIRKMARHLGLSRNTVRTYVRGLGSQTDPPPTAGSLPEPRQTDPPLTTGSALEQKQIDPPPTTGNFGPRSLCEVHNGLILAKLQLGLTAQRIYQDLKIECSFAGSYEAVKRFVRKLRQSDPQLVQRIEVQPGEEVQVDFGSGPTLSTPQGRRRRTWIFRMVLSYSRKAYSEAVYRQTTENFIRCLENAFRSLGGVPLTINLDNLKAAVLKADWADPVLNPKLIDFARHYGTNILPCLPRTPEHKGKVESGVKYVKGNALAGRRFEFLAQLNQSLAHWEKTIADQRIHGTTKRQVAELFAIEQAALQPLPPSLFACFEEAKRIVHSDGYVEVEKAFYDVPPEYLRRELWVRYDSREVRIFTQNQDGTLKQIQMHRRLEPGQFTKVRGIGGGHGSLQANLDYWHRRASELGSDCARWAEAVVRNRGIEGMRSLMGLVSLSQQVSPKALNQSCERALAQGTWRLRDVRALLHTHPIQTQLPFEEHHPLIRNLKEYGIFIRTQTQTQTQPS